MANYSRLIKLFSATTKRVYEANGTTRTEKPEQGVDDKVNAWVKETGNVVVQASSSRHTTIDKRQDGGLTRKTTTTVTVIYMKVADYLESEVDIRRRAMLGTGGPGAVQITPTEERVAVSDEDERRMDTLLAPDDQHTVNVQAAGAPPKENTAVNIRATQAPADPAAAAEAAMAKDSEDD